MNVLKNLLILTTFLGYKSFALAAKCNPSKLETRFSEVISKMPNLWGKYPSDTTFAIDDKTVLGNGYYVISSPEEAKKVIDSGLAEPCDGKPEIYKIKTASIVSENFFPGCSSLENEDACLPPLKDFYEKTKRNVGLHRADSKKHAKSFTSDGFKKHLNPIQIAVYDVSHEMFHSYQEDTGKFDSARKEPAADYLDCLKHAEWSKQYRTERKWWKQKVSEIYNPKTDQEKLRSLAVEFTDKIRPNTPKNKACNMSLDHIEIVEGTAHFVGNLGMLEIGVITHEELATIDS